MIGSGNPALLGILAFLGIVALAMLASSIFTVDQQSVAVIQRFGKFLRMAGPGLNLKVPIIDQVAIFMNLRTQQLVLKVETKTKDNVFLHVSVAVQFSVSPDKVYQAYYSLQDPSNQITAFVFDVVRAHVPSLDLDDVFLKKDEIAQAVKKELGGQMSEYGYSITTALVTDIDPDERVKSSMNEINANQRLLEAAKAKGEAEKVLKVKQAEAEAESKALQGNGIARERMEIAKGLRESAALFQQGMPGSTPEECMVVLLLTQYFDALKEIGVHSNTIMLPHSPAGLASISGEIRDALIAARAVSMKGAAPGAAAAPPGATTPLGGNSD
ncbi:MAG TPA: SPFH domain-containing protein [Candidatus Binataceae bacterium]|nr:SPFH domain-containing protein [Candidatus Binataceae bacterium]